MLSAEALAMHLEVDGHQTRMAHSGSEALAIARDFGPEIVLLDIGLWDVDGYEVARRLRELPGFERATLIAVTGYGEAEDRLRASEAGFDHHLVKPVDIGALLSLVGSVGEQRRP